MLTLSFSRFGDGIYISHTDVLRALNRTLRRAGIDVNYSKGYNKHMALNLTQPLPLGVASQDEWVTADLATDMTKEEFLQKFKENCPPFLSPNCVFETEKSPNLAGKVIASEYVIACENAEKYKSEIEKLKDGFVYSIEKQGKLMTKDATGYIYELRVEDGKIIAVFCYGNKNLRADHFVKYLFDTFGLTIPLTNVVRTRQLVEFDGKLVSAKEYMERL